MARMYDEARGAAMSEDAYGDIADEHRLDVEIEGEPAAEIVVLFEGENLTRLLWAVRELGIQSTHEFVLAAAISEIERQRMRLSSGWECSSNSAARVDDPLIDSLALDAVTHAIGPDVQVAQAATGTKALAPSANPGSSD